MDVVSFRLPGHPPTPNSRRDWHVTARDNRQWTKDARAAAWNSALAAPVMVHTRFPFDQAAIHVTFYFKVRRRRDLDNLIASLKPLIDGLVPLVLVDDSTDHLVRISADVAIVPDGEDETRVEVIKL